MTPPSEHEEGRKAVDQKVVEVLAVLARELSNGNFPGHPCDGEDVKATVQTMARTALSKCGDLAADQYMTELASELGIPAPTPPTPDPPRSTVEAISDPNEAGAEATALDAQRGTGVVEQLYAMADEVRQRHRLAPAEVIEASAQAYENAARIIAESESRSTLSTPEQRQRVRFHRDRLQREVAEHDRWYQAAKEQHGTLVSDSHVERDAKQRLADDLTAVLADAESEANDGA